MRASFSSSDIWVDGVDVAAATAALPGMRKKSGGKSVGVPRFRCPVKGFVVGAGVGAGAGALVFVCFLASLEASLSTS